MAKTLYKNAVLVLPGRKTGRGDILVDENGKIAAIGKVAEDVERLCAVSDVSDFLIMPGLVNCHGHTAMTLVRGLGGGLPLQRWLEEAIFPVEAKMTAEDVHAGAIWGIREMLAGGTTCVADMYDFPGEGMGRALRETGMKGRVCRVGLGFVPGRLEDCISFTREFNKGAEESVLADICIHSEYLTDEPFCRALAEANKELKRPVHLHASETEKEHEECIARHGKTPIAYLAETGLLDCGGYVAHCVWATDDDFRIMADKNVTLVHNPTSNMKLGSGFARIPRAMELGVNVALGTDGCASNDNLDMFEEMHLASLIHKGVAHDPTVLSPWDVIEMATINGAKALGAEKTTGSLEVGKDADFAVISLLAPHLTPCLDVANLIVNSMHSSDVAATYVKGKCVSMRGILPSRSEEQAFNSAVSRLGLAENMV
ncbi:MAG: amidohydrolase [Kiritimatiellae bacterium]|nr:amidohydrolase [Kiritimatiellia bacterium]